MVTLLNFHAAKFVFRNYAYKREFYMNMEELSSCDSGTNLISVESMSSHYLGCNFSMLPQSESTLKSKVK